MQKRFTPVASRKFMLALAAGSILPPAFMLRKISVVNPVKQNCKKRNIVCPGFQVCLKGLVFGKLVARGIAYGSLPENICKITGV